MDTELGPVPDAMVDTIVNVCTSLGGWCPVPKGIAMAALILREKPQTVVEVGVFRGRSLIPQALAVRQNGSGIVYAVDAWAPEPTQAGPGLPDTERWWATNDFEADYAAFMEAVKCRSLEPWVEVMRCESAEAAATFYPEPCVDMVHLDGNHSEGEALRDVTVWLPKLRPGSWLWLDDTDWTTLRPAYNYVSERCIKIKDWDRYSLFRLKGSP